MFPRHNSRATIAKGKYKKGKIIGFSYQAIYSITEARMKFSITFLNISWEADGSNRIYRVAHSKEVSESGL
jgi:hypothetical protein